MMQALVTDVREMISEQFEYHELLYQMTARDLLLRYKQTFMGVAWAIFMPLLNTALFSIIFTRVASIHTDVPYPLFAYTGLLMWNFFASSLRFSVVGLTSNSNLVGKVYFPREIFAFSAVLVSLADFAVASLVLVAMMVYYQVHITVAVLYVPVVIAVLVMFTAGMGLILAMGNLFYRDVKYVFEILLTIWMFATSVLYPVGSIDGRMGTLIRLNPITGIIDALRAVVLTGSSPFVPGFTQAALISAGILIVSWVVFHRAEFEFAENI